MPDRLAPMLATAVAEPPVGDDWLHEIKLDGYRTLVRVRAGEVRFFTRSGIDWTARFAALLPVVEALDLPDAWLDGEVVALMPDGRSSFGALQAELSRAAAADLHFLVFDLPYYDRCDLRLTPLAARKDLLARVLAGAQGRVRYVDHVRGGGEAFHRQSCAFALEGALSKRADSAYRSGRWRDWRKHKCRERQEFVVIGWTEPSTGTAGVGALALATRRPSGALAYAGRVGTGWNEREAADLGVRLRTPALATTTSPVADVPAADVRGVRWVRPELVVEVEFAEWTRSGHVRHASFLGVREDKPAAEVVREGVMTPDSPQPDGPAARAPRTARDESSVRGVRLTHPDKVLFADIGVTKSELARYYDAVAEHVMPHLLGRPLTLVRCPHGAEQACFYQKEASVGFPEGMRTVSVQHEDGIVNYALADSIEQVIGLVQLGVLELHTWGALEDDVETPDRIVIDLDPGPGVEWKTVCEAALLIRDGLAGLGLTAFAKTTGSKGLHVVTPIVRAGDWGAVKEFSRAFCAAIAATDPAHFTINPLKVRRENRVFIDYVRNSRGATAVAAYSTRARPGATVSVPVRWDEVEAGVRSDRYDIRSVPRRLGALRADAWAGYEASRHPITEGARNALGLL